MKPMRGDMGVNLAWGRLWLQEVQKLSKLLTLPVSRRGMGRGLGIR